MNGFFYLHTKLDMSNNLKSSISPTICPGAHELLRYLLVKLAPVLLGVKPSGLLRLTSCRLPAMKKQHELFCLHQNEILAALQLECRILKRNSENVVVLFFRTETLRRTLAEPAHSTFLAHRGYSPGAELKELETRCRENQEFPHEIGVFLGYPLKDVCGYIENPAGCLALPRGLWRVAGDPGESLKIMERFRRAEATVRKLIERNATLEETLLAIHNHLPAA